MACSPIPVVEAIPREIAMLELGMCFQYAAGPLTALALELAEEDRAKAAREGHPEAGTLTCTGWAIRVKHFGPGPTAKQHMHDNGTNWTADAVISWGVNTLGQVLPKMMPSLLVPRLRNAGVTDVQLERLRNDIEILSVSRQRIAHSEGPSVDEAVQGLSAGYQVLHAAAVATQRDDVRAQAEATRGRVKKLHERVTGFRDAVDNGPAATGQCSIDSQVAFERLMLQRGLSRVERYLKPLVHMMQNYGLLCNLLVRRITVARTTRRVCSKLSSKATTLMCSRSRQP